MSLREEIREIFDNNNASHSEALIEALAERLSVHSKKSQSFDCPICRARLYVNLEVRLRRIVPLDQNGKPLSGLSEVMAEDNAELFQNLEETGIAKAFFETLERAMVGGTPRNPQRHLLDFIKCAVKVRIARHHLRPLIEAFQGQIDIYAYNHVAAVVASGYIRCFIPYPLLKGETVSKLTANGSQITTTKEMMTERLWLRGKYGYVIGTGPLFNELRQKSFGDFAVR